LKVLKKHKMAFAGTSRRWIGKEINLELKVDAKPYYNKFYQIPPTYYELVWTEVDCLEKEGVLSKVK